MDSNDNTAPNFFRHAPLQMHETTGAHREFRVLIILPGTSDEEVICRIKHVPLPEDPNEEASIKYEALSWTWGDVTDPVDSIVIRDEAKKDRFFPVRRNLKNALRHLRSKRQERHIWVDFVCINQDDHGERASQVKLMFFIYGKAFNVCVWLGEHDQTSEVAMKFVKDEVYDLSKWTSITKEPAKKKWAALAALMERPWFSRRWVVQELALAVRATVHCEDIEMDWTEFETAVSLFHRDAPRLSGFFKASEETSYDHDFFGSVGQMAATRLVQLKSNLFRLDENRKIIEYRSTLLELVSNLSSFQSQEPHDMIYAILSIARDTYRRVHIVPSQQGTDQIDIPTNEVLDDAPTPPILPVASEVSTGRPTEPGAPLVGRDRSRASLAVHALKIGVSGKDKVATHMVDNLRARVANRAMFNVDYTQHFFAVCKQFLKFALPKKADNKLDILLRPWAPYIGKDGNRIIFPSWIPTVEHATFKRQKAPHAPGGYQMKRQNADPLVAQISHGPNHSPYNANQSRGVEADEWNIFDDPKDFRLQVTAFVLDRIANKQDASQDGHVPQSWLELGSEGFKTTDARFKTPDALWRTLVGDRGPEGRDTMAYYHKAFEQSVEECVKGINTSELKRRGHPILLDFLNRLEAVVWNRRMFKSLREKALGLAPAAAENGDYICVVKGMSVPVILRREGSKRQPFYKLIGECYLHTFMDGRAISVQETRQRGLGEELVQAKAKLQALQEAAATSSMATPESSREVDAHSEGYFDATDGTEDGAYNIVEDEQDEIEDLQEQIKDLEMEVKLLNTQKFWLR